jgi:hypothetical protein
MALEIAIFGFVPGIGDPGVILIIMLSCLGGGLGFILITFVAGFAYDIERQINVRQ